MIKQLFITVIIILLSPLVVKSDNYNFLKHNRLLLETNTIPCESDSGDNCICPGACMTPNNSTKECQLKKCYGWDKNLGICKEIGPDFTSAIVLQAIPITGFFGAGFGNMGRWELFGIAMGILFGGCILVLLFACACCFSSKREYNNLMQCWSYTGPCLWISAVIGYWIWGIVVIASRTVDGPNGCPLVN